MVAPAFVYLIPYVLSASASIAIAIYAWGRSVAGSRQFPVLAIAHSVATFGYILELARASLRAKKFWENIQTIALLVWQAAVPMFALQFTGGRLQVRKIVWTVLAAPFVIFLVLLFSDPLPGLVRVDPHIEFGEPSTARITTDGLQLTELWI